MQGHATLRNPADGAVAIMGAHADVICQDSEAGYLIQFTSKVDADFALVQVFYREKREPLLLNGIEVVANPKSGATVMLDPFPTKQADVEKVVVTWVTKAQEETFTPSQH